MAAPRLFVIACVSLFGCVIPDATLVLSDEGDGGSGGTGQGSGGETCSSSTCVQGLVSSASSSTSGSSSSSSASSASSGSGGSLCGPATCAGCCDSQGVCQSGKLALSCGKGGEACIMCPYCSPTTDCSPPEAGVRMVTCVDQQCDVSSAPWGCCTNELQCVMEPITSPSPGPHCF